MKIEYTGHFVDWFLKLFLFIIGIVCTGGLLLPYVMYWTTKYIANHISIIHGQNIYTMKFKGNFWEWFLMNIILTLLSIGTIGILGIYQMYWNTAYFFKNIQQDRKELIEV